jgi:hypothetical protein
MRRFFVATTLISALSLAPALLLAQTAPPQNPPTQPPSTQQPPTQQPTGQQPTGQQPPGQQPPKEPRLAFTGDAGVFLYQIKPDLSSMFEEMLGKVKEALTKSTNPVRKQQLAGWKVYKAAEPMGPEKNALYVFVIDPALKGAEYDLFVLLAEGLGPDAGTPDNQAMFKKYTEVFAAGANRLNLTPVSSFTGGM